MTARSRLPATDAPREMVAFLDNLDRKQIALRDIAQLSGSATLADVITKINEILSSQS